MREGGRERREIAEYSICPVQVSHSGFRSQLWTFPGHIAYGRHSRDLRSRGENRR